MLIHKPTGLRFKNPKPWTHQLEAVKFLAEHCAAALYTKPGSGKTRVFLDLIKNKGWKRGLVIATKNVCEGQVWEHNASLFAPSIRTVNLGGVSGSKKPELYAKAKTGSASALVVVINYESVWREPFRSIILKEKWDFVICDESHRIKTPGSKVSKFMTLLGRRVPNRYLCTGTPLYSSPEDVYAQYRYCDPTIFGTNLGDFRKQYENIDEYRTKQTGYRVLDKKNPYINQDELTEKLMSIAYCVDVDLSLPPVTHVNFEYTVSAEIQKHLKTLKQEHYIETRDGIMTVEAALTMFGTRQQLMSGYVKIDDKLTQVTDERFQVLYRLLEDLGDDPVIIFARYRAEINAIKAALGKNALELSGKCNELLAWQKGKAQYLIVQPQSGAEGVDMTRAHYAVYFSKMPSYGLYEQSLKRLDRPGQKHPICYYHIVGKLKAGASVDEEILRSHQLKQDVIDYIMWNPME